MFSRTKTIISRDKIGELVRANFGESATVKDISELTDGMFNAIYVVNFEQPVMGHDRLVLKAGVQTGKYILTYERDILRTEVLVYGMLDKAGVPVPKIICHDFSKNLIDCDYFFMEFLRGETWGKLMDRISPANMKKLHYSLGVNTAKLHSIRGPYFGYIKEDRSYQFETWREAFRSFVDNIIADGRGDGIELPYEDIYECFEPYWDLLDAVKEPSLVNYDMWAKNIMLIERDGEYVIDGIIDHERSFYGDPIAEFISTITICRDLSTAVDFQEGYRTLLPFTFGREEQIRYWMYFTYMGLLGGVEMYRYEVDDVPAFLQRYVGMINMALGKIRELGAK